jgi:hypothetical protein
MPESKTGLEQVKEQITSVAGRINRIRSVDVEQAWQI